MPNRQIPFRMPIDENVEVQIQRPIRRIFTDQENSTDGLDLLITPAEGTVYEGTVYAMTNGYLLFGYHEDERKIRAIFRFDDNFRKISQLECYYIVEYQNLDIEKTKQKIKKLIKDDSNVRNKTWLNENNNIKKLRDFIVRNGRIDESLLDRYLNRYIFSSNKLKAYKIGVGGAEGLPVYPSRRQLYELGLWVPAGAAIGVINKEGDEFKLFLKFWNELFGVMHPLRFFHLVFFKSEGRLQFPSREKYGAANCGIRDNNVHPLLKAMMRSENTRNVDDNRKFELAYIDNEGDCIPPPWFVPMKGPKSIQKILKDNPTINEQSINDISDAEGIHNLFDNDFVSWQREHSSGWPWLRAKPNRHCCGYDVSGSGRRRYRRPGQVKIGRNAKRNFDKMWNKFIGILSTDGRINIVQFATLAAIIIRENPGFQPNKAERGSLEYFFKNYDGRRYRRNNREHILNEFFKDLINNQNFLRAHYDTLPDSDKIWAQILIAKVDWDRYTEEKKYPEKIMIGSLNLSGDEEQELQNISQAVNVPDWISTKIRNLKFSYKGQSKNWPLPNGSKIKKVNSEWQIQIRGESRYEFTYQIKKTNQGRYELYYVLPTNLRNPRAKLLRQADFCKFRGRGYIQITFRSGYKKLVTLIKNYTGNDSTIKKYKRKWNNGNEEVILTQSKDENWDELFSSVEFACLAVKEFFDAKERGLFTFPRVEDLDLQPRSGREIEKWMLKIGWAVSGGNKTVDVKCSVELNLLRAWSLIVNMLERRSSGGA